MSIRLNLRCLALLLMFASFSMARGITYVVLWFDTEDYIDPIADDAALRIANDLTSLGVHGTFKVVGEKARVLEQRGRTDVIQALGRHCIGYHSDWHSVQPVPALVLQHLGLLEGAGEFERRQRSGFEDVARIFSVTPACYGQPGVSWAPQSNLALRRMGVHVYLDEGTQVGYGDQPIWADRLDADGTKRISKGSANLLSRSCRTKRIGSRAPSVGSTARRAICAIQSSAGCWVVPASVTRRVSKCSKNRT